MSAEDYQYGWEDGLADAARGKLLPTSGNDDYERGYEDAVAHYEEDMVSEDAV